MFNFWIFLALFILTTIGIRLLFEEYFIKKLIGLGLLGHSVNLCLLLSGWTAPNNHEIGNPAFIGFTSFEKMADPLPQALILTAIVIGFGVTAFLIVYYLIGESESE